MRLLHGRVERGRIIVDETLPEGAEVTVVASGDGVGFELEEDKILVLLESLGEAERGEIVSAAEPTVGES